MYVLDEKIRKLGILLPTPVFKVGFRGIFIAQICFHDGKCKILRYNL